MNLVLLGDTGRQRGVDKKLKFPTLQTGEIMFQFHRNTERREEVTT